MSIIRKQDIGLFTEISLQNYSIESYLKKNSNKFSDTTYAVFSSNQLQHLFRKNRFDNNIWHLTLDQKNQTGLLQCGDNRYHYNNEHMYEEKPMRPNDYPIDYIKILYHEFAMRSIKTIQTGNKPDFTPSSPSLDKEEISLDKFVKTASGLYIKK